MESNFLTHIETKEVAEACDSDSQLLTDKEAIEKSSYPEGNNFSKLAKENIIDGNTENVNLPTICSRKKIDIDKLCGKVVLIWK